ncbi:hypothetical protein TNCV_3434821 [Trichonephila clavipes]|nr:hypothetical protein TNCV_3434821 [Trichonephila clavipes]
MFHISRISLDCLRAVNTLPWPERSPDLLPIEDVWDIVGYQIWALENIADFEQQLLHEGFGDGPHNFEPWSWMTPELAPPLLNTTPQQREDV